jgi:hypothetical protein
MFHKKWSSWLNLVQLVLVELSFGQVVVLASCRLVELVSVDLSVVDLVVVELVLVELKDYPFFLPTLGNFSQFSRFLFCNFGLIFY